MVDKDKRFIVTMLGILVLIVLLLIAILRVINKKENHVMDKGTEIIRESTATGPTAVSGEPTTAIAETETSEEADPDVLSMFEAVESIAAAADIPYEMAEVIYFIEENPVAAAYFSRDDVFLEDVDGVRYVAVKNMKAIAYPEDVMLLTEVNAEESGDNFSYFQYLVLDYGSSD